MEGRVDAFTVVLCPPSQFAALHPPSMPFPPEEGSKVANGGETVNGQGGETSGQSTWAGVRRGNTAAAETRQYRGGRLNAMSSYVNTAGRLNAMSSYVNTAGRPVKTAEGGETSENCSGALVVGHVARSSIVQHLPSRYLHTPALVVGQCKESFAHTFAHTFAPTCPRDGSV